MKLIESLKQVTKERLQSLSQRIGIDTLYIARGSFWSTLGFFASSLFSLFLVIAFANLLPKDTYGTYRFIMSIAGFFSFLTLSGMNAAVTQAVASGNSQAFPYSIRVQLKWNILYALGLCAMSAYYMFNGNSTIGLPLLVLGGSFPIYSALNTYGAYLNGKKDFKMGAIYSAASTIFYSLAMLAILFSTDSILALSITYAIGTVAPAVFFYLRIKKEVPAGEMTDAQKSDLLNYGGHSSIVNIFSNASQYVDKLVLFHYLGAIEVAVYGLALAIPERLRGYTKNVESLILPKLSERSVAEIAPVFYRRVFQGMAVGMLLSATYIVLAPFVFKLFLPKYLESILYSQVIALQFIFTVPAGYVGGVFRSQKMIRTIYLSSVAANISRIVLFIVLGAYWGIWGIIIASLSVYFLGTFYNFILWEIEVRKDRKNSLISDHK